MRYLLKRHMHALKMSLGTYETHSPEILVSNILFRSDEMHRGRRGTLVAWTFAKHSAFTWTVAAPSAAIGQRGNLLDSTMRQQQSFPSQQSLSNLQRRRVELPRWLRNHFHALLHTLCYLAHLPIIKCTKIVPGNSGNTQPHIFTTLQIWNDYAYFMIILFPFYERSHIPPVITIQIQIQF